MPAQIVLDQHTISRAIAAGRPVIAGSYHASRLLMAGGVDERAPGSVMTEGDKQAILREVSSLAHNVRGCVERLEWPEALAASAQAEALRAAFGYLGHVFAERVLERPVDLPVPDKRLGDAARTGFPQQTDAPKHRPPRNYTLFLGPALRGRDIDLRSPTGVKIVRPSGRRPLRVVARRDRSAGLRNWVSNLFYELRTMAGGRPEFYARIGLPAMEPASPIPELEQRIAAEHGETIARLVLRSLLISQISFAQHFAAMRKFLKDTRLAPPRALFNNVGFARTAAYASALEAAGALTSMQSHGCLVEHGDEARRTVAAFLARTVYNDHPAMQEIWPRSPLQARGAAPDKVRRQVRVVASSGAPRVNSPARLLYAPNFLTWNRCYHGLTASCFETRACAEHLVTVVRASRLATLDIRIKTTVNDVARREREDKNRGLLPSDIADLIDPGAGIFDASTGSHQALLASADLVITEGITAVIWEALELGKPVLLLNQDPARVPSVPAWGLERLRQSEERNAVYAASCADPLDEVIARILKRHRGQPLTDAELRPFVWVD